MRIGFGFSLAAPMAAALIVAQPDPVISFSGSGYAGSVYSVANGGTGKWQRGPAGVWSDLDATTTSWAMTPIREGDPIRWLRDDGVASNVIEMLMPGDLGMIDFDARVGKTVAAGLVTQWIDRTFGDVATQTVAAYQLADYGDYILGAAGGGFNCPALGSPPNVQFGLNGNSTQRQLLYGSGTSLSNSLAYTFGVTGIFSCLADTTSAQFGSNGSAWGTAAGTFTASMTAVVHAPSVNFTFPAFRPGSAAGLLNNPTSWARGVPGPVYRYCVKDGAGQTLYQRQQLEGILAWTYGLQGNLPSDHPYKSLPPRLQ